MSSSRSTLALVQTNSDQSPTLKEQAVELPELLENQVYVDIEYAAQNPTDGTDAVQALATDAFGDGTVLGCDFVGLVHDVSIRVSKYKKGDRIAGLVWGGEFKGLGAYSKRTIADEDISFKLPETLDPAAAATVPLACCTAWLALFSKDCLGISRTQTSKPTILIWGGSSSVGLYSIQIAAMYSFNIVTTCSPANFDLVKSMGATHVFDYKSDNVVDEIKAVAPDLTYIFDTIGSPSSSEQASQTVQKDDGVLCTVRPGKAFTEKVKEGVKVTDVLVWTAFLRDHNYKKFHWPASHADHELSTELFQKLPEMLKNKIIKPNNVKKLRGLESVEEGFALHKAGKISAYKLVYEL